MDQDEGWGPCEFQLANCWAVQEPAPEVWSPAAGLPVECHHASIDMVGTCHLQAYFLPQSCEQGQELQQVEYYYAAANQLPNWPVADQVIDVQNNIRQQVPAISSKHHVQVADDLQNDGEETGNQISHDSRVSGVFEQVSREFQDDIANMKLKMHRYPASLQALHESYTVPRIVAIGPYHHGRAHLKPAEKVKHMAAIRCVVESGYLLLEEMYAAVASVADDHAHRLYDKDAMAGISCVDFRDMMFVDACFLVQYMRMRTNVAVDKSLLGFLGPNGRDIRHDIVLLENQLPWKVVETVMRFTSVDLETFISGWKGYVQHRKKPKQQEISSSHVSAAFVRDKRFDKKKPHLLGLLRYYTVGRSSDSTSHVLKPKDRPVSVSAIELAEIGISLTANKTMKLIDMGLKHEGTLFAELSLAPLYLDRNRASLLLNMAAVELSTIKKFSRSAVEGSAVCSYLLLLANLVSRQEDVQVLRARGLLLGGGGLTDEEAFRFFASFQGLRFGRCYNHVMSQIESYKEKRRMQTKLYTFFYKHKKIMAAVATVIGALGGIIGTLLSIKKGL